MTLLDRYLLREWLTILGLVLAATLGLVLIQTLFDDFRDLMEANARLADVAMYVAIKIPSFLAIVLPVIILVSLLYALGQLHRSNEITVLRASGLGMFQITRVIWIAGLLLCALMWMLNASIVPRSVENARKLLEELSFRREAKATSDPAQVGLKRVVTFDNQRQGRLWFINRYSRLRQVAYGVTVSELDISRREKIRLYAREAKFDPDRLRWTFFEGREVWFDPENGEKVSTVPFQEKTVPYYTEDPALMLVFDLKPSELSFFQLRRIIDYFTADENPKVTQYAVRYYGLIADTLAPLIVIAIAIPFAMTGVRVNPAVGVSKSLGLFLLYFILLKLANALGVRGTIDPAVAACVPSIVMLAIGGWFLARMR